METVTVPEMEPASESASESASENHACQRHNP